MKTACFEDHVQAGGKIVDFGGWKLPVQYIGVIKEHEACRQSIGLFDVSHMGEFHVTGPETIPFLNRLVTNDVAQTQPGQAQYTAMCQEDGGIIDDLITYHRSAESFLVVVNASNIEKDFQQFQKIAQDFRVQVTNESKNYSLLAVQGPNAEALLSKLCDLNLSKMEFYRFAEGKLLGEIPLVLARTGYTGEDGFEVFVPWGDGSKVWNALLEAGKDWSIQPVGLAARDTLRMEMKYALYGQEITLQTNPIEAGLGWVTKMNKGDFVGRAAIEAIKSEGLKRKLVGLELLDRGIPRKGYPLLHEGTPTGVVTSGTQSPSLKKAIAIGYVQTQHSQPGTDLQIEIRGKQTAARVVKTPFYRRDS